MFDEWCVEGDGFVGFGVVVGEYVVFIEYGWDVGCLDGEWSCCFYVCEGFYDVGIEFEVVEGYIVDFDGCYGFGFEVFVYYVVCWFECGFGFGVLVVVGGMFVVVWMFVMVWMFGVVGVVG